MSFCHILFLCIFLVSYGNSGDILRKTDKWVSTRGGTLLSSRETFEAGFFRSAATEGWFLGIWYRNVAERTYVWVGNRQAPVHSSNGTLEIYDGQLVIRVESKNVWASTSNERRGSSSTTVAHLLENGNLVLKDPNNDNPEDYFWQSFEEPTDTILPQMKIAFYHQELHMNKYLTSWRALDDPQPGDWVMRFENTEYPVLTTLLKATSLPMYRSGPWNGTKFIGAPALFKLTWKDQQVSYLSIAAATDNSSYTRVKLGIDGSLKHFVWNPRIKTWEQQWSSLLEKCDMYDQCLPNSYCRSGGAVSSSSLVCECIPGFEDDSDVNMTRKVCVRKKHGTCNGDHFLHLQNLNLPDIFKAKSYPAITKPEECSKFCLRECSCTAYSISRSLDTGNPNCITWSGDLTDIRSYSDEGLDLYVRTAGRGEKRSKTRLIIIGVCVCISVFALFALFCCCKRKRKRERERVRERERATTVTSIEIMMPRERQNAIEDQLSGPMDFAMILRSTNNFSQEIGHGGFGYVYKGVLASGEEIAVKKLSESSKQGLDEFRTEVRSISRLRHINIVRLYGWSVYNEEKLLIYEYLANGSLERHLFGGGELSWEMRFHIIKGIAQGLAYIEEGAYDLILHRDLKPDNILLDREMTAKISDFGLARMCARSDNEVLTRHKTGTVGYMSPESLLHGIFSSATDVFSFGVIVLEIVHGRRNRSFSSSIGYLLGYAWNKYNEGNWSEIIDAKISQNCVTWQVLRCIEVGLLCSQSSARDRPKISLVVAQLQEESIEIQKPKHPGFYPIGEGESGIPSSSNMQGESSTSASHTWNAYTATEIDAR